MSTNVFKNIPDIIGDRYVRSTRFSTISSGTNGTIAIPQEQLVILDDFGGGVDAIITTIENGRPTNSSAKTIDGIVIATTFDAGGNYTLTGTPSSYPVAIIYRVRQKYALYNDLDTNIVGISTIEDNPDYLDPLSLELEWFHEKPNFYTEPTYDINNRITSIDIWDSPAKTFHIFNKVYTYNINQLSKVEITRVFDGIKLTKDFTYNIDGFIENVVRTYTV